MKKLIVMVVLVCLSAVTFSEENGCGPTDTNTNKTKQTTPAKILKKRKKWKNKYRKKMIKTQKILIKQAERVKLSKVID